MIEDGRGNGYVYVLSNKLMPDVVKVGRSIYGGKHRSIELYKNSSGVPGPFVLEFEVMSDDPEAVERRAHDLLAEWRVNTSREFFGCEVDCAIHAVLVAVAESRNMSYAHRSRVLDYGFLSECAHSAGVPMQRAAVAISTIPVDVAVPYIKALTDDDYFGLIERSWS